MDEHLDAWCTRHLGSGIRDTVFAAGHLSRVAGVRLTDAREVVLKIRAADPRLTGCADVHQAMWKAGFPCPQSLAGPAPLHPRPPSAPIPTYPSTPPAPVPDQPSPPPGRVSAQRPAQPGQVPASTQPMDSPAEIPFETAVVSAEVMVPGGEMLGLSEIHGYASLLAKFVQLAPAPDAVRSVLPNPPWTDANHSGTDLWPAPDDRPDDLNAHPEPAWLQDVGERTRRRLRKAADLPTVIGHGDWEAQNLRWHHNEPLAVHDWDSVIAAPEPVIIGLAAAVWPCGVVPRAATVDETAAFLEAYQHAAGTRWSTEAVELAWAAGLWVNAFNTKKAALDDANWLAPAEAADRLHRAGA